MIDHFGPGVGHLNYDAVPGVGIFEFLFVPATTNHFPGGEFQLYLTSHFCPGVGNLTAICWKMSKSRPMPRLPPVDIDRCIKGKGCDHTIKSSIVTKQANPSSLELPEEVSSQHCSSDKTGDWTISH